MLNFQERRVPAPDLPRSMRQRLRGLSGRLPGYVVVLGALLRRRRMPAGYSQALAREAGFGRMPVRVPGSRLPGFRHLGKVAVLGVLLHVMLRQKQSTPQVSAHAAMGPSVFGLRDDASTIVAIMRWVITKVLGRRARLRSEV